MKTLKEGLKQIKAQEQVVEAAEKELGRLRQQLCDTFAPVKLGDTVESNYSYAHGGKKMVIDTIWFDATAWIDGKSTPAFIASGCVLRKDGTTGRGRGNYRVPAKE